MYLSKEIAEDVLIELWAKHDYPENRAPLDVYQCSDCHAYHLTSRGPMNERLSKYLSGHRSKLDKEASKWLDRFKKL